MKYTTRIRRRLKRMGAPPFRFLGALLSGVGLRRRVLVFDYCNWAEIDWAALFGRSFRMWLLYKTSSVNWTGFLYLAPDATMDLQEIHAENYQNLSYRGLRLWELSKTGILASLETTRIAEFDAPTADVVDFYYRHTARLIDAAHRLFDKRNPDTILLSQGCMPMTRPVVEVARERGINIVATEGSFLKNYVFLDNATGMIVNRHKASRLVGDWLEAREFSPEDRVRFRTLLAEQSRMKRTEHRTDLDRVPSPKETLGIPREKKVAVFLGQVLTDASQIIDSPTFADPVELISRVVRFFQTKEDWFLVIRLHPKECDGASWVNDPAIFGPPPGLPDGPLPYKDITLRKLHEAGIESSARRRIRIVGARSIDTQALMREADLGITVNSQAGFEMALKHKRVVVCGDAFYARKGFTYDVAHPATLPVLLEAACENPRMSEEEKLRVDQLGDYMLNEFLFPRSFRGSWGRFFKLLDGGYRSPLRAWFLRRAAASLERRNPFPEEEEPAVKEEIPRKAA